MISTSPELLKTGNSFWGIYVEPPIWDLLYRFVREREGRETTEEGPRTVREVEGSGCETMKTCRDQSCDFERGDRKAQGGLFMGKRVAIE